MELENTLTGAWDTHVHAGPDVSARKHDIAELARLAADAEMGGLVLKNHHFPTTMAARLVENRCEEDIQLASTVVLNRTVGGLNTDAVIAAAAMGASRVELPTMAAAQNMLEQGRPRVINLLNDQGELEESALDVLTTAVDHGMVVGTGHIGVEEVVAVVDAVVEMDGEAIITHPELHAARDGIGLTPATQSDLARPGIYFERCSVVTDETISEHFTSEAPPSAYEKFADGAMLGQIVEGIEATGPEHNLLSTDYGQPARESPPEALADFHTDLRAQGVSQAAIVQMAKSNPECLFGNR